MNRKRILVSEEEKQRILNSHKTAINEDRNEKISFESGLSVEKEFIVSESELKNILGKVLTEGKNNDDEKKPKRSIKYRDMQEVSSKSCKSNSDCGPGKRCLNSQCEITTTTKENEEPIYEIEIDDEYDYNEMNEMGRCPKGMIRCGDNCCPSHFANAWDRLTKDWY